MEVLFYSFSNIRKFIFNFPSLRVFFFFFYFQWFLSFPSSAPPERSSPSLGSHREPPGSCSDPAGSCWSGRHEGRSRSCWQVLRKAPEQSYEEGWDRCPELHVARHAGWLGDRSERSCSPQGWLRQSSWPGSTGHTLSPSCPAGESSRSSSLGSDGRCEASGCWDLGFYQTRGIWDILSQTLSSFASQPVGRRLSECATSETLLHGLDFYRK